MSIRYRESASIRYSALKIFPENSFSDFFEFKEKPLSCHSKHRPLVRNNVE